MKRSTDRILTTHSGSLSRPADLIAMNRARAQGEKVDDAAYAKCVGAAVADVVRKQREVGIDIPDDGEFGKPMAANYDYGVWWNYAFARMEGFVPAELGSRVTAQKIQRRRYGVDDDDQSSRLAEVQRFLSRSRIDRHIARQRGAAAPAAPGLHRPDQIHRARRDCRRYRQPEESDGGGRRGRGFHVLDRAGKLRSRRGPLLQDRRGIRLRCRRCDARRI